MENLEIFNEAYKKMNLKKEEKTPSAKPEKKIKLSEIAGQWWDEDSVKTGVPPMIKRRFSGAEDEAVTNAGKNIFTFGHGYFYRHGMTPEKVGQNVQEAASKCGFTATILAKGDNFASFKGSAKSMSAQDSFMWVVASLVRNKKEEVQPEVKPKEEPEVDTPKTHEESKDLKEDKDSDLDTIMSFLDELPAETGNNVSEGFSSQIEQLKDLEGVEDEDLLTRLDNYLEELKQDIEELVAKRVGEIQSKLKKD